MLINPDFYATCCQVAIKGNAKRCPICRTNLPYRAQAADLRHGDVVQVLDGGGYHTATVKHIDDRGVLVVRPYVHTSDFLTSGGLLTYLGTEEFTLMPNTTVLVLHESTVQDVIDQETDEGRRSRHYLAK